MINVNQHILNVCYHCGESCSKNQVKKNEKVFCCNGCKTVYEILNNNGLCQYYDYNLHPGISQSQFVRNGKFDFLNDENIAKKLIKFSNKTETHVSFYLPQIHCSSCLWLLENIQTINENIISSTVNFIKKEVFIVYNTQKTSLKEIVESLTSIGYEPHLNLNNLDTNKSLILNRTRWYKIGVAGFCFSNIMMLSFPEYLLKEGSIEPNIALFFKTLIIILSIPVLFYSASEFIMSAYKSLKQKYLNIDAPVAIALLITFVRSTYEIITSTGNGYLDSMSGIVFFMLIGRWLQDRTYNLINFDRDYKSFFPIAVNKKTNNKFEPIDINLLKENDVIQIHAHEIIPADSILSKGEAKIDYSFVNGENLPVNCNKGELIYAGGKQIGQLIELIIVKPVSQSYLTSLWNKDVFKKQKENKNTIVDIVGKYFTYGVLLLGIIAAAFWGLQHQTKLMWNALTTVLIVACPCALLLSENFTYSNFIRILGLNKFYVKNKTTLENILKVDDIVLDKTGTLTHSNSSMVQYIGTPLTNIQKVNIAALLNQSIHTLSNPIINFLGIVQQKNVEHFKETQGKGIEGWIDELHIKIGSAAYLQQLAIDALSTEVYVEIDKVVLGKFCISNDYREDIFTMINELQTNYDLHLLSGDNEAELNRLKTEMAKNSKILFNQKPLEKLQYIENLQMQHKSVAMIGDGLNDAGALKQSNIGIAVTNNNNVFTPASDAIIEASQLRKLHLFFKFVKSSKSIIFITFMISALYNVIGLYYAMQGILSPLIAAVLMPLSSITIVGITYFLSIHFASKNNLKTN